ncbi:MAG: helix-turn-helix transcriptional regulator [Oscillospiraceae bacterium]|nr:helix-turn-helix transcriptional regulator [Oscillospiraceae bacterium]
MNLGDKLYKLRTERNMSQGDLADALGVSRQSISKWETNSSVPELDRLIKLSEIFNISLDELVREECEIKERPQEQPQIQTVYVEKASSGTAQKIIGVILLCFGAVVLLLLWIFAGNAFGAMIFAAPFVLCGFICILVKSHAWLWCCWGIYFSVEVYLRYATGITWKMVLFSLLYEEWMVQLIVAWVLTALLLVLLLASALAYRKTPINTTKENLVFIIAGWIILALSHIPIFVAPFYISPEYSGLFIGCLDWCRHALCVIVLINTVRYIASRRRLRRSTRE